MSDLLFGRFRAHPTFQCGVCTHYAHIERKPAYTPFMFVVRCLNKDCVQFDVPFLYESPQQELYREPSGHPELPAVPGA